MGHGAGKENDKVGIAHLPLYAADRFDHDLGLMAVIPAQALIFLFHTFISAEYHNAHVHPLLRFVVLILVSYR